MIKCFVNFILLFLLFSNYSFSQEISLSGKVSTNENNTLIPLQYANIYWFGRTIGTVSDENGAFTITKPANNSMYLIVSYIGYKNDTILILKNQTEINVTLEKEDFIKEITIEGRRETNYISKINPIQSQVITTAGLQKLACCNLSESFENNATVDVAYTDAVTGAKQIQMLGLAGIYSQILTENISSIRGLATSHGLGYIPGTWMESIQISKGTSSVINGFESITGQINVELKKPENSEKFHFNVYGNEHGKFEGNITSAYKINKNLSSILMIHGEDFSTELDNNNDKFLDLPKTNQLSFFNKWRYEYDKKFVTQFGIKFLTEERNGGQINYNENIFSENSFYGIGIGTKRYEAFAKLGIPFSKPETSIGFLINTSLHKHTSFFGNNVYNGNQRSLYSNLIYQFIINNTNHKVSSGLSYQYDNYDEYIYNNPLDTNINEIENIPGFFAQYTYSLNHRFILIAGIRTDLYNNTKTFITPRLHLKYDINETFNIKLSAGKGYRTPKIFIENLSLLASSKKFIILENLNPEEAWNYGINFTKYFNINGRKNTIILDFYRTDFNNQIIVDMDTKYNEVSFYNLNGISYSNSAQIEIIIEPIKRLELNAAFRINDVRTTINDNFDKKPFVNKYKGLFSTSYSTKYDKWQFDFTIQYIGIARLPNTDYYPEQYRQTSNAPSFYLLSSMITKRFKYLDLYIGAENLTNFIQKNTIISSNDPYGEYFDTSFIWGPIIGRNIYAGIRLSIK